MVDLSELLAAGQRPMQKAVQALDVALRHRVSMIRQVTLARLRLLQRSSMQCLCFASGAELQSLWLARAVLINFSVKQKRLCQ